MDRRHFDRRRGVTISTGVGESLLRGDEDVLSDVLGSVTVAYDAVGDADHAGIVGAEEALEPR